jgi:xanthine dehydrogenase accessory factor
MLELYREITRLLESGQRGALATVIGATGSTPGKESAKMLVREDGSTVGTIGGGCTEADVWALAREAIEQDRPLRTSFKLTPKHAEEDGLACGGTVEIFIEPLGSPLVFIFGAGHIALELAPLVHKVGMGCVVVDDRPQFANRERFPEARQVVVSDFETCFDKLTITPSSYLVIVTRGHRYDQFVLSRAVRTAATYVGLIGSKAKIGRIFKHLRSEGVAEATLARIRAPIGLDIGCRTPEEIAVSIVAELIAHRRRAFLKGDGRRLRFPRLEAEGRAAPAGEDGGTACFSAEVPERPDISSAGAPLSSSKGRSF